MHLKIDKAIFDQHPDLKIGAILIHGMNNSRRISTVESLLRGTCAQKGKEFAEKDINEDPKVQPWNQAYGHFGINPKKNACSIAALLKRVKAGNEIPHINALVDLYNYFSLKYVLPIGGEDIDWLCGDLHLKYTEGDEPFRPICSIDVERTKEGEIGYVDDAGVTCRYWNHRECERTKFTEKTVNGVLLIEDLTKIHMDEFGKMLKEMAENVAKYIGGRIEIYILSEDKPSIDLGVEGRKNADDSKVPQQEKAYFEMQTKKKELSRKSPTKEQKEAPKTPKKPVEQEMASDIPLFSDGDDILRAKIKKTLQQALKKAFDVDEEPKVEYPSDQAHGDYASNIGLQLSKQLKKPPQEIAQAIVENIDRGELIEKAEIAGPGFINIFISRKRQEKETKEILSEGDEYGQMKLPKEEKVIVEYSAPNIAKPLGVHHLLSTVIGQTIRNIMDKVGFNSISINHIGDWGTQFGKLIYAYKKWGDKETLEKNPIDELLKLYVKFHEEVETDPSLEDNGREEFRKFEEGDKENRELWEWFREESLKEIEKTYAKLHGIHFDHVQGESFYEDKMEELLEDGKKKEIFVEGEKGAFVAKYDDPNMPPFVVQKKDGATLYSTRDFAALKYRVDTWNPAKIIYVVDIAQTLHFKQLFKAASRFPWYENQSEHVWFGRMHMKEGGMSTRKGNVVLLNDVIDEAIKRAGQVIEEKNPDLKDKEKVAETVGIGAIKYNILSQNRTTDITFDWDRMLSLDGNSAPYLQYSYARAKSILRKIGEAHFDKSTELKNKEFDAKTASLVRMFPKFKEAILDSAKEYKPNIISNYLYELAQKFNSFYNAVPVLKSSNKKLLDYRLGVVKAASQILKNGLAILGVDVSEEM